MGQSHTPSCKGVASFLLMGPSSTEAVSGITTALSQACSVITLRWSRCSLLKSLAHPRVGSVPLLPFPPTAGQHRRCSWQGNTSSGAPRREICAKIRRHTQRRRHAVHTTDPGMDSAVPGADVNTLKDGDCHSQHTHIHTHTGTCTLRQGDPNHHPSCPPPSTYTWAHTDRCM